MEISLSTGNWASLLAFANEAKSKRETAPAAERAEPRIESEHQDNDEEDEEDEEDELTRLNRILTHDPIAGDFDSYRYNADFGEVFLGTEGRITQADFEALGRFIASFCPGVGEDGRRFRVPMDANLRALEWYAVMSPATLRELIPLPESVDRRAFRAAVREALARGDGCIDSVGDYFDYLNMWTRAYRLAAAEDSCAAILLG